MAEVDPVDVTLLSEGAYNTYAAMMNFKDMQGDSIPQYPDAGLEVCRAWEAAIKYVIAAQTGAATSMDVGPVPPTVYDENAPE